MPFFLLIFPFVSLIHRCPAINTKMVEKNFVLPKSVLKGIFNFVLKQIHIQTSTKSTVFCLQGKIYTGHFGDPA
jgi:hypothetical protein